MVAGCKTCDPCARTWRMAGTIEAVVAAMERARGCCSSSGDQDAPAFALSPLRRGTAIRAETWCCGWRGAAAG
jgi:hypothetical protein